MLPAVPNAPPAMAKVPPLIVTGTDVLMPLINTEAESIGVETATLFCGTKLNAFGAVIAASVLTVKVADTPPMVTVALAGVAKLADDNTRTMMV